MMPAGTYRFGDGPLLGLNLFVRVFFFCRCALVCGGCCSGFGGVYVCERGGPCLFSLCLRPGPF